MAKFIKKRLICFQPYSHLQSTNVYSNHHHFSLLCVKVARFQIACTPQPQKRVANPAFSRWVRTPEREARCACALKMALSGASFRSYVFLSICLSGAVVGHAAFQKRFFYRTMVYLGESKLAFMAVANLALVSVMLIWKAVQRVFLGPLRFREVERLNSRARDAIIECCFATTIFREEVNLVFLALVTILLMLKSLHWLAKDRMDYLEEQPLSPRIAHVRLVGFMGLLFVTDSYLVWECAKTTFRTRGGTMLVLFAFEFTVLLIELCSDFVRYVFHAIDLRMDGRWDSKGLYSFYNELVTDMCQLTVYLAFFLYVHTFYTFPLHILREVYLTFSKFQRRCSDFIRYRRVVSTMNELFADATEEELAAGDRTCIICREEMTEAKKLACGHMFHARCLQSWLKRQLSCPTCRTNVDVNPPPRNSPSQQPGPPQDRNVQPPVGGAVPPPPDDVDQGPGFWHHARRLWRHIVFNAPRDGEPQQPAQPQPQPNRQHPQGAFRVFPRRMFPNVRVGFRLDRVQGPNRMGNRPQEMGPQQAGAFGFVPLQNGAQLPPGFDLPPDVLPPGVIPPNLAQVIRHQQPQAQGTRPPQAPPTNMTFRPPRPNAPPIEQLIEISENLARVRSQVDSLRNQVKQLLVQATEQAATQSGAARAGPSSSPAPAATSSATSATSVTATSSIVPVVPPERLRDDAQEAVTPAAREVLPENFLSKEESTPAQTTAPEEPVTPIPAPFPLAVPTSAPIPETTPTSSASSNSDARVEQTEEKRLQEELRAKRLAFLSTQTRGGESSAKDKTAEHNNS